MNTLDAFGDFGATATPVKRAKPAATRQEKFDEKKRLSVAYRRERARMNAETLAAEPRLRDFARFVRSCSTGAEIVDAIRTSWLPTAPDEVRFYALRIVSAFCDKMDRLAGFDPPHDPLPPETSTFFEAKEALRAR